MSFEESRLLDQVRYGTQFGHTYRTRIRELISGHDRRNAEWSMPRERGLILYENLDEEDHAVVVAAHHACMGSLIAFRFKNWADFTATSQPLGTGTGAEQQLQLKKTYTFGSQSLARIIYKPVLGTVQVYEDGSPISSTVDYTTGIVTVTATLDSVLTWSGEFDFPMRFESDELMFSADDRNSGGLILTGDVGLIEVRL